MLHAPQRRGVCQEQTAKAGKSKRDEADFGISRRHVAFGQGAHQTEMMVGPGVGMQETVERLADRKRRHREQKNRQQRRYARGDSLAQARCSAFFSHV